MTVTFLAFLALAWIAVFLPAALRARRGGPLTSAERFKRRMRLIAPSPSRGRWVVVPGSTARLRRATLRRGQRRRRHILNFLVLASASSALAAVLRGGGWWEVHIAFDLSLAVFVALLIEAKRRRAERDVKVRSLVRARAEPVHFYEPARASAGRQQ